MTVIFGEIPGVREGDTFASRQELHDYNVHSPTQAGIAGRVKSEPKGAESIVISGGYEDDIDMGDVIIYTGAGGRDENTGKQMEDQVLKGKNKALAISCDRGLPVRVVKLIENKNERYYEYSGLYDVQDYWIGTGISGYRICRYKLVKRISMDLDIEIEQDSSIPDRRSVQIERIIRNPNISLKVKELYDYHCQVCNQTIELPHSNYIEAAHIRPLGQPHDGPDTFENILALCPNHHIQFDRGGIYIKDNFELVGYDGKLTVHEDHDINKDHIQYHRNFRIDTI